MTDQLNGPGTVRVSTVFLVDQFAEFAHAGQFDKIGVPYIEHPRAVAAGLTPFGEHLVMAGLLHDVLEDTPWTAARLRDLGVPDRVIAAVEAVTNKPGTPYLDKIAKITQNPDAILVKIADNAHNSHPGRAAQLTKKQRIRLGKKYRAARKLLWAFADTEDIRKIVEIVNPALLEEL